MVRATLSGVPAAIRRPPAAPPWLDGARLGERQVEIGDRHGEVLARFQAAVESDTTVTDPPAEPLHAALRSFLAADLLRRWLESPLCEVVSE